MATKTARAWTEIRSERSKLSHEERTAIDTEVQVEAARIRKVTKLDQLRRARALSQVQMAQQLGTNQGGVSRIERQTDLYMSTLRRFVHAMGGTVHITAQFADGEPIELDLFGDLESVR